MLQGATLCIAMAGVVGISGGDQFLIHNSILLCAGVYLTVVYSVAWTAKVLCHPHQTDSMADFLSSEVLSEKIKF